MRFHFLMVLLFCLGCATTKNKEVIEQDNEEASIDHNWKIQGQEDMIENILSADNLAIMEGLIFPKKKSGKLTSTIKRFSKKRSANSLELKQSSVWENWIETDELGTKNMTNAPIFLRKAPGDYWIFARNKKRRNKKGNKTKSFETKDTSLIGFDIPLKTTPIKNEFNAPGSFEKSLGGYNAWQSHDMVNWVYHGSISDRTSSYMTTAEQVGDETYLYYDFPNDQDPHLIIDTDLMDGRMGMKMGMAFEDPSDGSDCGVIRDLDGNFHMILENWSPINASKRSWDSPLASHAVSKDGISGFKLVAPAVDYRTSPTGEFGEYAHPHWHKQDPGNYLAKEMTEDILQHRIKKGQPMAFARYEIHEPEQDAYGDWASIAIGSQYYLFGDYDAAGSHGRKNMKIAWFTSSDINKPFTFCGSVGNGHPDPDIIFAEGQFYLISQTNDFVSPGPWVETVTARVGVDTNNNGEIDKWTTWETVKESYDYVLGFSKHVATTPAILDLSGLPKGYGFQIELKIDDSTDNNAKPMIESIELLLDTD